MLRDGLSRGLIETLIVLVGLVLIVLDATGTVEGQVGGGLCITAGLGSIAQRRGFKHEEGP